LQEKYAQMETHLCGTYLELLCVCSGLPNAWMLLSKAAQRCN
jgi:hypothetical protein